MTKYLLLFIFVVVGGGVLVWLAVLEPPSPPPLPLEPPSVPSSPAVQALSSESVLFTWFDSSDDESGFVVSHSSDGTRFFDIMTLPPDTREVRFTGLIPGSIHYYRVRSFNATDHSVPSDIVSVELPIEPGPPPPSDRMPRQPSGLRVVAESHAAADLSWIDNADNETGFVVERSRDGESGFTAIGSVSADATVFSDRTVIPATTYSYRVRAYNAVGMSASSNVVLVRMPSGPPPPPPPPLLPPDPPSRLEAAAVSPGEIRLSWVDDAENETGFSVERSRSLSSGFSEIVVLGANRVSYVDTNLNSAIAYYYRVRAINAAGRSAFSNTASATTPAPPASFNVTLTASGDRTVTRVGTVTNAITATLFSGAAQSVTFSASGLPSGVTASFVPAACSPTCQTTLTLAASATATLGGPTTVTVIAAGGGITRTATFNLIVSAVPPSPRPAAPTNLAATAVSATQVNLSWRNNAVNATGVKIERAAAAAGPFTVIPAASNLAPNTTAFSDTGRASDTAYWYRVIAFNNSGDSDSSNIVTVRTPAPSPASPAQPTNLTATAVSSSEINLTWVDNAANETAYVLERGTDGANFSVIAPNLSPNTTTYTDRNLSSNTRYYYRVKAVNSAGSSNYSNTANATTQVSQAAPDPPTNLRFTSVSHNEIALAWSDASSNETGFRIERGTDNVNFPESWTVTANITAFTDRSVATVTTYYYRVRAYNALGASSPAGPLAQRTSYERGFVRAQGEDLYLNGRKWYPHAVNYFPSFYVEGNNPGRWWLENSYRNAANIAQVDRELAKLHDLGFNTVTIQGVRSASAANCANLNDFLDQAKEYNLRVGIFMHNSDPLYNFLGLNSVQTDLNIIRTCGLASNDIIFGYETDWEPSLEGVGGELNQPYTSRRRNDSRVVSKWRTWVEQNYGNIAAAYQNWGFAPPNPFPNQEDATCVSHDIPRRALAGFTYTFHLTMKNVGSVPWSGSAYQLWPFGQPLPGPVNPGQTVTFTFDYPIPPTAAPPFTVPWRMAKNGQAFGDQCETTSEFVTENPTFPVPLISFEQRERLFTPTDAQLCTADQNASSRKYTVAFLHFVNEFVGEEYRRVTNLYRGVDQNHILYPHAGSPSFDWEFGCQWVLYNKRWSIAKYFDVISEEIYLTHENLAQNGFDGTVRAHGFLAGYDDIGKPIYVNEVGLSSGCDEPRRGLPQGFCSEGTKRTFLDKIYDLIMSTPFKGAGIWWFTGRQFNSYFNLYDNYGLVEPNTLVEYPAAALVRNRSAELTGDRTAPVANTTLTVDPDSYPNFQRFYAEGGDRYLALSNANGRRHIPVETTCSNKTSANVELACVGNAPNSNSSGGRCPLKCLRAHFSPLKIKDRNGAWVAVKHGDTVSVAANTPLEAEAMVENIRETGWLAGGNGRVRISVETTEAGASSATERFDLPIGRNVSGLSDYDAGRFIFSQGIRGLARVTFFLEAVGRSPFGEWIEINLAP